jgi:general secretion pathway protein E
VESRATDLEGLGFDADLLAAWKALLAAPQGLMLVTGPSGSGKTTTLYASLLAIRAAYGRFRSVATLEDPVERNLGQIAQTEVSTERGLTFPAGLKALLRQDPEVLMIGEIRDGETARIAVQAGLTGHLVLSTLHTSSAFEALVRLADLGIEPGLAAGALRAVLCQRLVPLACVHESAACARCQGTGLAGRRAVGELLAIEGSVRDLVRVGAPPARVEEAAARQGFVPLARRAMRLVECGQAAGEMVRHALGGAA